MTTTYVGQADPRAYMRLAALVRQQIAEETLLSGRPAPTITYLSQQHGHARQTCAKALRLLKMKRSSPGSLAWATELVSSSSVQLGSCLTGPGVVFAAGWLRCLAGRSGTGPSGDWW
jgi:hypothetical protein